MPKQRNINEIANSCIEKLGDAVKLFSDIKFDLIQIAALSKEPAETTDDTPLFDKTSTDVPPFENVPMPTIADEKQQILKL